MGEEDQYDERIEKLMPYQVNAALFEKTENPNCIFMHCLPAFHDFWKQQRCKPSMRNQG